MGDDLAHRLTKFAARIGKVVDAIPDTRLGRHVAGQRALMPGGPRSPQRLLQRIQANDANGDGKITRQEASRTLKRFFDRIDVDGDGDGAITTEEIHDFIKSRRLS